jgi:hypothetical protein
MAEVILDDEVLSRFKDGIKEYSNDDFWKLFWKSWNRTQELDKIIVDLRSTMIVDKRRNNKTIRTRYIEHMIEAANEYKFLVHYIMAYRDDLAAQVCAGKCQREYENIKYELQFYSVKYDNTSAG